MQSSASFSIMSESFGSRDKKAVISAFSPHLPIIPFGARSPHKSLTAPTKSDLPLPVSPVTTLNPGESSIEASGIIRKFFRITLSIFIYPPFCYAN